LRAPIGKQDQYGSAFGGCNVLRFARDGQVDVRPLELGAHTLETLEQRLQLYFTGVQREANKILREQQENVAEHRTTAPMADLLDLAVRTEDALAVGNLDEVGALIREGWERKRGLASGVTNERIDA